MEKSDLEKSIANLKVETILGNFVKKSETPKMRKGNSHKPLSKISGLSMTLIDREENGEPEDETFAEYKKRDPEEYKEIIDVLFELVNNHGYGIGY